MWGLVTTKESLPHYVFTYFFLDEHAENVLAHQFVASMYECFGFKTNLIGVKECYHSVLPLVFDFSKVINEMNPP